MPRYIGNPLPEDEAADRHPAVRQLLPAIRAVRATFKPARHVQLNWLLRELVAAMDAGDIPPEQRADARALMTRTALAAFLLRADADAYRPRARNRTDGPSPHSALTRRTVLRHIARAYGRRITLDRERGAPARTDLPTPSQRDGLWSFVASADLYAPTPARRHSFIRLAALVGIVLDTGARSGEITAATLTDLDPGATHITLTVRPQNGDPDHPQRTRFRLSLKTRNAVNLWLPIRHELTTHHEGGPVTALWVTVRPGGWSGRDTPGRPRRPVHTVGMPLSRRTITAQYADAAQWLNTHRRNDPTWQPIPTNLERLRLTSTPAIDDPPDPDTGAGVRS